MKGVTGRNIIRDFFSLYGGLLILLKYYLIYKLVGIKVYFCDWNHYGTGLPPFGGIASIIGDLSEAARERRYNGTLMYYGLHGDKDPRCLEALGPELAKKVILVALPYANILDYMRMRLIGPRMGQSVNPFSVIPVTANMCYKFSDELYCVVYDPTAKLDFGFYHELGHVVDDLKNGEEAADKFALDHVTNYNAQDDILDCFNEAVTWCEHISGSKISNFEAKVLMNYYYINHSSKAFEFEEYVRQRKEKEAQLGK